MEHTPGPWEAMRVEADGFMIRHPGWEIRTPSYDVATWVEHGAPIRKEADAHLLAAAPDLLDGLVRAEQTIRNLARCGALSGDYIEIAENEAANLRADIAKARGGREEAT